MIYSACKAISFVFIISFPVLFILSFFILMFLFTYVSFYLYLFFLCLFFLCLFSLRFFFSCFFFLMFLFSHVPFFHVSFFLMPFFSFVSLFSLFSSDAFSFILLLRKLTEAIKIPDGRCNLIFAPLPRGKPLRNGEYYDFL